MTDPYANCFLPSAPPTPPPALVELRRAPLLRLAGLQPLVVYPHAVLLQSVSSPFSPLQHARQLQSSPAPARTPPFLHGCAQDKRQLLRLELRVSVYRVYSYSTFFPSCNYIRQISSPVHGRCIRECILSNISEEAFGRIVGWFIEDCVDANILYFGMGWHLGYIDKYTVL